MALTPEQLAAAANSSINYFLKNDPIDQINTERPLIKKLMEGKTEYAGGLQYVVEQLRISNDSNFQSYSGNKQVTYNRKRTLNQAKYAYGSFHDGFGLDEDELTANGITMTDEKSAVPTDSERVQLTNLLKENNETLKLGFQENFDLMLHRDGSASTDDIPGLDALIDMTPATGTVGTIDASTATYWRNFASLNIADADLIDQMELAWRECTRYGGSKPDFILVGDAFLDKYRSLAGDTVNRQVMDSGKGGVKLDASVSGVYFKGVELVWDPVFDVLDTLDAPAEPWSTRCYFINTRFLKLRPIKGHWMIARKPPRVYDRYVHYSALTSKAALTTGKRNAHAVLNIA